jgi:hypothetical protein
MIYAEMHGHDFPDLGPGKTAPDDPAHFGTLMLVLIGPVGDEAYTPDRTPVGDWFDFFVCTPSWLGANFNPRGYDWGRFKIIVQRWDEELVLGAIQRLCDVAPGPDWTATATYLSRFGQWEYDEYAHRMWHSP